MQQVGRHCHYQRAADEENYQLCELIYEHFGTQTVVVRLHDPSNLERFHRLGALVVHPTTALVNLMDHFVRSPLATWLLLGLETGQDLLEVEACDPTRYTVGRGAICACPWTLLSCRCNATAIVSAHTAIRSYTSGIVPPLLVQHRV
jgi:hypothetical protein